MSSLLGRHEKKYRTAARIRVTFSNSVFVSLLIANSGLTQNPSGTDPNGAITHWLILGPYKSTRCALPDGCDNAPNGCDFLTDGREIVGDQWEPRAGDEVESDCGRSAACLEWICAAAARADRTLDCLSGGAKPKVAFNDPQGPFGYVDLRSFFAGDDLEQLTGDSTVEAMAYAWTYVRNNTGQDLQVMLGHNSSGPYRLLFNHLPVSAAPACRDPNLNQYDQETFGPLTLKPGLNTIMMQSWRAINDWGFRIRLYDAQTTTPLQAPEIEIVTAPPVIAVREIPDHVAEGEAINILINIRKTPAVTPQEVQIREVIPRFWNARDPSPPGVLETDPEGRQSLVWILPPGAEIQTLAYVLDVPTPYAGVRFNRSDLKVGENRIPITGDQILPGGSKPYAAEVLVVTLRQPTANCGGDHIGEAAQARDYLTNGDDLNEQTVLPLEGSQVLPDFDGASPSPEPNGASGLIWQRVPAQPASPPWPGGWYDLDRCDDCMSYVAAYAVNATGQTLRVRLGSSSDDGEQILLDGVEVWNHSVPRGSLMGVPQDHSGLFDLRPGKHLILQKVFEGCGGFNSSFRFEDEDYNPLVNIGFTVQPRADQPRPGDPAYSVPAGFVVRGIPRNLQPGRKGTILLKLAVRDPLTVGGTIEEEVPSGFSISEITGGGVQDGQRITWTLDGELSDRNLTYQVAVPEGSPDAQFHGSATLGGTTRIILGDVEFNGAVTNSGFIRDWLVLGPLETQGLWTGDPQSPPGGNPDAPSAAPEDGDLRLDFLTDGSITEHNLRPFDGMRIHPSFGGDGKSGSLALGLEPRAGSCVPGEPTWEKFRASGSALLDDDYFGDFIDSHATYAVSYLRNDTGAPIVTNLAFDTDDAFIAFIDGVEACAYEPPPCSSTACGRILGPAESVAAVQPVTIDPGEHVLLTRLHDGIGPSGRRLRFQDDQGNALLPPALTVSTRSKESPPEVTITRLLSGDEYRPGVPLITTLHIESQGPHDVLVRDVLPSGWSAIEVSDGGILDDGEVTWDLREVNGDKDLSYRLIPLDCSLAGRCCGNGAFGSQYTVDQQRTYSLQGDSEFRRSPEESFALGPWDSRDIGSPRGGVQRVGPKDLDVFSRGRGAGLTKDGVHFVSIPQTGDFEISTRIDCVNDPVGTGQFGLMLRDTYDAFSAEVFFFLKPTPGESGAGLLRAVIRRETLKTRTAVLVGFSDASVLSLPIYLKIAREQNRISLRRSEDGLSYREIGFREIGTNDIERVAFGETVLVGLAAASGSVLGSSALVSFRNVEGNPDFPEFPDLSVVPPRPQNLVAKPADARADLSWEPGVANQAPTGYVVLRDGIRIVALPPDQTGYSDTSLENGKTYCYQVQAAHWSSKSDPSEVCTTPGRTTEFRRGDIDGNGRISVTDAVVLLGHLFLGTAAVCLEAGDTDNDGTVDISDAIRSLGYQFLGGPPPVSPGPTACGPDPVAPFLGCTGPCSD